jgi:hypothetical protein
MSMSFWEFRSEALGAVHEVVTAALEQYEAPMVSGEQDDPVEVFKLIEQICMEGDLAFDGDGGQVEEDELRENLEAHYGEPREISWNQKLKRSR